MLDIEVLFGHDKPKEQIEMSATVSREERLAADRALFAQLSVEDLQELAEDSERFLVEARGMAQRQRVPPAEAALPAMAMDNRESTTGESAENTGDVDNAWRAVGVRRPVGGGAIPVLDHVHRGGDDDERYAPPPTPLPPYW